jgi:multidrug resistance efflux pump
MDDRARAASTAPADTGTAAPLAVHRGVFQPRFLITGELAADRALELKVPRTRTFQLQVRRIADDGTPVRAGEPVVELDNSSFTSELEEKRLAVAEAATEVERKETEQRSSRAEKEFEVQKRRSDLEKARIKAAVPEELLSKREYQDRQLELRRSEVELAKAEDDLAASRQADAAEVEVERIHLESARREVREAEEAIASLTLRAPRAGILVAAEHPWEGRKVREGDTVWAGLTVAILPDLASMIVEAKLSDVDDGRIVPGLPALCYLDAYPALAFPGRVAEISPVAREAPRNPTLRSFPVRVTLDRPDPRMRPGMSVRVEVLGREIRDALLAPRAALDLTGPAPRLRLADGGAAPVRLGPCSASECVLEQGPPAGTRLRAAASAASAAGSEEGAP